MYAERRDIENNWKLNPFFRIKLSPPITCDLFLDKTEIAFPSHEYLKLIAKIADQGTVNRAWLDDAAREIFNVNDQDAASIVEDLIQHNAIIDEAKTYPELPAVEHWIKRGWLDALMLHMKTKNLSFSDNKADNADNFARQQLKAKIEKHGLPELWKEYKNKTVTKLIEASEMPTDKTFQEIILQRRSHTPWRATGLRQQELSNILHYANIETCKLRKQAEQLYQTKPEVLMNSAFSALETYLFVFEADGIQPGLYHYMPNHHSLTLLKAGIFRKDISRICIGQQRPGQASCAIVMTAVIQRYMYRYQHSRAYRTLLINTAELAQKYITLATAYNLSTFLTPAFNDNYAEEFLDVNSYEEAPLYAVAFG
ncbi:MAG: hypothetical protein K0R66_1175 [Gammaproteobacteria bacterium]|jgi:SagB-type dehydrogenase family enzyme|nr:hypothetical protein [Gammaproteobacteria bacterium]